MNAYKFDILNTINKNDEHGSLGVDDAIAYATILNDYVEEGLNDNDKLIRYGAIQHVFEFYSFDVDTEQEEFLEAVKSVYEFLKV